MRILTPSIPCIRMIVPSLTVAEPSRTTVREARVGLQGIVIETSTRGPAANPSPSHGDALAGDLRARSEPEPVQAASPSSAASTGAHGRDHPQPLPAPLIASKSTDWRRRPPPRREVANPPPVGALGVEEDQVPPPKQEAKAPFWGSGSGGSIIRI